MKKLEYDKYCLIELIVFNAMYVFNAIIKLNRFSFQDNKRITKLEQSQVRDNFGYGKSRESCLTN